MQSDRPNIPWNSLDFDAFANMAGDSNLSKYEKIGFPDSYRAGFEKKIFNDIRLKLPGLKQAGRRVVDVGPGCSDLPVMLIDLCRDQGHELHLVDSSPMLANLPDAPFVKKRPGLFPDCCAELADLTGQVDVILCYSVLHYVFIDSDPAAFMDAALSLLAPGGELLIGDVPNVSKRRRFFASAAGIAYHQAFTGTNTLPPVEANIPGSIDDAALIKLLLQARAAGADAYLMPQDPDLPMANRREDLLIRKP